MVDFDEESKGEGEGEEERELKVVPVNNKQRRCYLCCHLLAWLSIDASAFK